MVHAIVPISMRITEVNKMMTLHTASMVQRDLSGERRMLEMSYLRSPAAVFCHSRREQQQHWCCRCSAKALLPLATKPSCSIMIAVKPRATNIHKRYFPSFECTATF
jgi:hypothetical protein